MSDPTYPVTINITNAQGATLDGMNCGSANCLFAHSQLKGTAQTGCRCVAQLRGDQVPAVEQILSGIIRQLRGEASAMGARVL